jgi:hypothetical protein
VEPITLASSPLRITETMGWDVVSPKTVASGTDAAPAPVATSTPPPTKVEGAPAVASARSPSASIESDGCTVCKADSYSPLPAADERKIGAQITPYMKELRACLDRVGANLVRPVVHLRFTEQGVLLRHLVDVGGFESLECIKATAAMRPLASASRGTTLRCEYKCSLGPRYGGTLPQLTR